MSNAYEASGYGSGKIELGERPAILVVDFQKAFTDPRYPLGRFEAVQRAVDETARLLEVARRHHVPVASCYTAYHSRRDMPHWKIAAVNEDFFYGHPSTELDPRIRDDDHDFIFCKSAPSIFFNTPLTTFLAKHRVDTVIVTGCITSGCIRASVIDSFSFGYRTVVAADCSGDADREAHDSNLRDMSRRYAEIATGEDMAAYIRRLDNTLPGRATA
jgi:maleamate amidohydrolase